MKVIGFEIEESKVNKGSFILVATVEDGSKFVIGNSNDNYCTPYENSWDTDSMIGHKANNKFGM